MVPRAGRKPWAGSSAVDAALDGVAAGREVFLAQPKPLALRDAELGLDEVDAVDHLGDCVLDLDAGVHLKEEGAPILIQEFERASAHVANGAGEAHGGLAQLGAQRWGEGRRGALLDQLLVAALHRAIALAEGNGVAVRVGENLDLDVARVVEVALDVEGAVLEGGLGLAAGALEGGLDLVGASHDAQAAPAAAANGLERHGVAELIREATRVVGGFHRVERAGDDGHIGSHGLAARRHLAAHALHRLGRRADKGEASVDHGAGKGGILAQKAVAGVDGASARAAGRVEDALDVEVAFGGGGGAEQKGGVGVSDVGGVAVGLAIHGDGA